MPPRAHARRIERIAREEFEYDRMRPGQEAAISALVEGRDTLAVMPTGSGKSAIYQIAGVMIAGPTVVISPLIALQRDQVASIEDQDVGGAVVLNSTMSDDERTAALRRVRDGEAEFLFLAPEQFNHEDVLEHLRDTRPSLFVVDEAHCISEWGHDFRPDYLRLGSVIESLGHPRVLALTATASPPVREEIQERLGMVNARVIVRGFDRPNIWLGVETFHDEFTKKRMLLERVAEAEKPGIVYAATRRHAEEVAESLRGQGIRATAYHAGMKTQDRTQAQNDFMADELEVIVATTAFGMGVDKPNVRFVYHFDISDSVDSYYQEIGRAGRDGKPAEAILFYRPEDLGIRKFLASSGQVMVDEVEQVAEAVKEHGEPVEPRVLQDETGLSQTKLMTALTRLAEAGAVEILPNGEVMPTEAIERHTALVAAAEEAAGAQERFRAFQRTRVEMMRGYAEVRDCRREYLLNYFGEEFDDPCGYCDNCDAGITVSEDEQAEPFPINSRVVHKSLGDGLVVRYEGDKMIVLFDDAGYRTLDVDLVIGENLLHAAETTA